MFSMSPIMSLDRDKLGEFINQYGISWKATKKPYGQQALSNLRFVATDSYDYAEKDFS